MQPSLRERKPHAVVPLLLLVLLLCGTSAAQIVAGYNKKLAQHVLRRMTYGPTPALMSTISGSLAQITAYIDQQLNPATVPETHPDLTTLVNAIKPVLPDNWDFDRLREYQVALGMFSEKQLQEMMTRFWEDHFNTHGGKLVEIFEENPVAIAQYFGAFPGATAPPYIPPAQAAAHLEWAENERFRGEALGDFTALLRASAKGPPMMFYLDTVRNFGPIPNENYARELLELHTLGIDPATGLQILHSQTDITLVAKYLTGWTLKLNATDIFTFHFNPPHHVPPPASPSIKFLDFGGARFLDTATMPTGQAAGELILTHLAGSVPVAEFVSRKLIRYFVSPSVLDATSPTDLDALVASCVQAWGLQGDIRAVVETILQSGVFKGATYRWGKIRRPGEHAISVVRALDGRATTRAQLKSLLDNKNNDLADRAFFFPSPDGPPHDGRKAATTAQVLYRVNFNQLVFRGVVSDSPALNYVGEVSYDLDGLLQGLGATLTNEVSIVDHLLHALYVGHVSPEDRQEVIDFITQDDFGNPATPFATLIGGTPAQVLEYRQRLAHAVTFALSLPQRLTK